MEKEKLLLENDKRVDFYSKQQLRHLLADLHGAGVDTTLSTLRWFLLFLSKNKTIQDKVQKVCFT